MTFVLFACLPVVLLLLPGGFISLSRSMSYSILHALDHEDREERRRRVLAATPIGLRGDFAALMRQVTAARCRSIA